MSIIYAVSQSVTDAYHSVTDVYLGGDSSSVAHSGITFRGVPFVYDPAMPASPVEYEVWWEAWLSTNHALRLAKAFAIIDEAF